MGLFRNLLIYNATAPQLYLIYNTASSANVRIDFASTSEMKSWINSNGKTLTGSLKAVRQNVDDGFTDYNRFFVAGSSSSAANGLNISSLDLSNFDTTGATAMYHMFAYCSMTTCELSGLNTSQVTSMYYMFSYCYNLTYLDLSTFDFSAATVIQYMFYNCTSLAELNLANITTDNVTNMTSFVRYCNSLERLYWATNINALVGILGSTYFNYPSTIYVPIALVDEYKTADYFSTWADKIVGVNANGDPVEVGLYIIYNTESLSNERIDFDTTADMKAWFDENASGLSGSLTAYRQGINDGFTDFSKFFCAGGSINTVDEENYWVSWESYPTYCYITSLDVSNFDTTGATNMSIMFSALPKIESIVGLNNLNTSEVVNMTGIFMELGHTYDIDGNETLSDNPPAIDISAWDVSTVSTIDAMFWCARVSAISMPTFSGANLLSMTSAFSAITTQDTPLALDLSMINTSSVIRMIETFAALPYGSTLNISNWNTSSVIDMSYMFNYGDNISTIDISSFTYESNPSVVSMLAYTSLDNIIGFENIPTTLPTYDRIFEPN